VRGHPALKILRGAHLKPSIDYSELSDADDRKIQRYLELSRNLSWSRFGRRIRFYAPSFLPYKNPHPNSTLPPFPSISVTGSNCSLNCSHCRGKLLETMIPATTPDQLVAVCQRIKERGGVGCLISGGCTHEGSVPLEEFADAISKVKHELGLTIVAHTGLIKNHTARRLKEAGVDAVLIDIVGSDRTIREVYHLDATTEDYDNAMTAVERAGIPLVPHVLVGIHGGKLEGEFQALQMISEHHPAAIIVIALIPVRGTLMESVKPPAPIDVAKILVAARLMLPSTPVVLGCARPTHRHRVSTDMLAIKAGVNGIAFPSKEAAELAESMGLETSFSPMCCSQIYVDLTKERYDATESP
jgi:uncharacterized radical SAM superfamily protein